MRDTQIALGLVPGALPNTVSMTQTNLSIETGDDFEADLLSQFLADFPEAIPRFFEGLDQAMTHAKALHDGESREVNPADETTLER